VGTSSDRSQTRPRRPGGLPWLARTLVLSLVVASLTTALPPRTSEAATPLTSCRFSSAQVFDVQWWIADGFLNISGITRPYASNEPLFSQLEESDIADTDTFGFYVNGPDVGFRQYNADGSVKNTLHLQGTFRALGPDFIFYLGGGSYGTVITTGAGFAYDSSAVLAVTSEDVTPATALEYSSCSSTPLAIGQTRGEVGGDQGPGPTPSNGAASDPFAAAVELAAGLAPTGASLVRDGAPAPVTTLVAPTGQLVVSDPDGTLRITYSSASRVTPSQGLVVAPDGEIVCEICARLAAGSVVEAWIYSEPRLAAAVRVDVDTEEGVCPLLRIPVGAPLDGAGGITPGAHTLQLRMDTGSGSQVLSIPITVGSATTTAGAVVPTRVNTGGGPVPILPLPLALGLLVATIGVLLIQRDRELAWAHAWAARQRRLRDLPALHLPAFDLLQSRLDLLRRSIATALSPAAPQPSTATATDGFDVLAQRLEAFRRELG